MASATAGYGCQLVSVSAGGQTVLLVGDSSSGQLMQQRVLAIAGVRWQ